MALADKVHQLWLEQEAFHRTCLGGKIHFHMFLCCYWFVFFVCVFVLLSLLPSGFPWVSVATCVHQLLFIFYIFYVLLLFQTFSFHPYFLTPVSSPPASLRSLAFIWLRFCVFTLFSQPLHTLLYWNFSACQYWLRERHCSHYFILCLINTGIDLSYLV